jgi:rhodanese-related sulfurtransferase
MRRILGLARAVRVRRFTDSAGACALRHGIDRRTLDEIVAEAVAKIQRFTPAQALAASSDGAQIVDIRSDCERARDGVVPGALHVPRTVFEWRLAPDSPWRSPDAGGLDRELIVICSQGYASILAAATLSDLGFASAGDVVGGFEAWKTDGMPVERL